MEREFMLYIRNDRDAKNLLTDSEHREFIQKCEIYIKGLQKADKLIAAQPLVREGIKLTWEKDHWKEEQLDISKEVQVGFYHINARDAKEAIEIAKANPEFEFVPNASIEIRPIKTKEEKTNYTYPNSK